VRLRRLRLRLGRDGATIVEARIGRCRRSASSSSRVGEVDMADLVFVGLGVGFFLLSWGFVRLCERL
jgi:hypothetical protein